MNSNELSGVHTSNGDDENNNSNANQDVHLEEEDGDTEKKKKNDENLNNKRCTPIKKQIRDNIVAKSSTSSDTDSLVAEEDKLSFIKLSLQKKIIDNLKKPIADEAIEMDVASKTEENGVEPLFNHSSDKAMLYKNQRHKTDDEANSKKLKQHPMKLQDSKTSSHTNGQPHALDAKATHLNTSVTSSTTSTSSISTSSGSTSSSSTSPISSGHSSPILADETPSQQPGIATSLFQSNILANILSVKNNPAINANESITAKAPMANKPTTSSNLKAVHEKASQFLYAPNNKHNHSNQNQSYRLTIAQSMSAPKLHEIIKPHGHSYHQCKEMATVNESTAMATSSATHGTSGSSNVVSKEVKQKLKIAILQKLDRDKNNNLSHPLNKSSARLLEPHRSHHNYTIEPQFNLNQSMNTNNITQSLEQQYRQLLSQQHQQQQLQQQQQQQQQQLKQHSLQQSYQHMQPDHMKGLMSFVAEQHLLNGMGVYDQHVMQMHLAQTLNDSDDSLLRRTTSEPNLKVKSALKATLLEKRNQNHPFGVMTRRDKNTNGQSNSQTSNVHQQHSKHINNSNNNGISSTKYSNNQLHNLTAAAAKLAKLDESKASNYDASKLDENKMSEIMSLPAFKSWLNSQMQNQLNTNNNNNININKSNHNVINNSSFGSQANLETTNGSNQTSFASTSTEVSMESEDSKGENLKSLQQQAAAIALLGLSNTQPLIQSEHATLPSQKRKSHLTSSCSKINSFENKLKKDSILPSSTAATDAQSAAALLQSANFFATLKQMALQQQQQQLFNQSKVAQQQSVMEYLTNLNTAASALNSEQTNKSGLADMTSENLLSFLQLQHTLLQQQQQQQQQHQQQQQRDKIISSSFSYPNLPVMNNLFNTIDSAPNHLLHTHQQHHTHSKTSSSNIPKFGHMAHVEEDNELILANELKNAAKLNDSSAQNSMMLDEEEERTPATSFSTEDLSRKLLLLASAAAHSKDKTSAAIPSSTSNNFLASPFAAAAGIGETNSLLIQQQFELLQQQELKRQQQFQSNRNAFFSDPYLLRSLETASISANSVSNLKQGDPSHAHSVQQHLLENESQKSSFFGDKKLPMDFGTMPGNMSMGGFEERNYRYTTGLVYNSMMLKHECTCGNSANHLETPERLKVIWNRIREAGLDVDCELVTSKMASRGDLLICHSEQYALIFGTEKELRPKLPAEYLQCYVMNVCLAPCQGFALSYDKDNSWNEEYTPTACREAIGSSFELAKLIWQGRLKNGFALVRPPGSHAEFDKPLGFCYFNTIAIVAKLLKKNLSLDRILIVDWGVHHGNGTQQMTYNDPNIMYISLHRHDSGRFFPGTGSVDECGEDEGLGKNVNIAWNGDLNPPMGDVEYLAAFRCCVMPIAKAFRPQIVLVSCGFDGTKNHSKELGGYKISPICFGYMTRKLMSLADGKVLLLLEGGYDLESLANCSEICLSALMNKRLPTLASQSLNTRPNKVAVDDLKNVIDAQQRYWPMLENYRQFIDMSQNEFIEIESE